MNLRAASVGVFTLTGMLAAGQAFATGELLINEYNAVGEAKFLEFDPLKSWEGQDTYFGRIQGNGGNWIELVVASDHLDIRGWTLDWSNSDPDAGVLTFSNDTRWSDLRSGTIITIIETLDDLVPEVANLQDTDFNGSVDTIGPVFNVDTDFSFDPASGDWWVNAWLSDASLFTTGAFKVDNDSWQGTIKDNLGATIQGPIGEDVFGWTGGGINSREVGRLELDPSAAVDISNYDDGDYSTFGAPNNYDDQTAEQDFSSLRAWFSASLTGDLDGDGFVGLDDLDIILNHWNQNVTIGDPLMGDITGVGGSPDGFVGLDDLDVLLNNWNAGTPPAGQDVAIPEPATLALLAIGASLLIRRA